MTLVADERIWPIALELASCLCRELTDAGGPKTCFCGIIPGDNVAFDYCAPCSGDTCGMAWVRLAGVVPMQNMSFGYVTPNRCAPVLMGVFEVGVLRCAPTMTEDGNPPTMAQQLDAATLQASDMAASGRAAGCCFGNEREVTLGGWAPIGPQGGCLGGAWTVSIGEV